MAARSLASLSLSFGLVSIPVKLYTATESSAAVRFNLLSKEGARLKQQYISEQTQKVVECADMVKGYEFEKGHFVIFSPDELKALEECASHMVDIVTARGALWPAGYFSERPRGGDCVRSKLGRILTMGNSHGCPISSWTFWGLSSYRVESPFFVLGRGHCAPWLAVEGALADRHARLGQC